MAHCDETCRELFVKIRNGDLKGVKDIVEDNLRYVNAESNDGKLAVAYAHDNEKIDILKYLLSKGATHDYHGKSSYPPLHDAAYYGKLELVKFLVKEKYDVNSKEVSNKDTPLILAVERNRPEVVRFLVNNKADKNAVNKDKQTPISIATQDKNEEVLKIFGEKTLKNVMASKAHVVKYNKEWEKNIGTEPTLGPARNILEYTGHLPARKGVGPSMPHYKADPDRKLGPEKWHIGKSRKNKRSKGSKKTHRRK